MTLIQITDLDVFIAEGVLHVAVLSGYSEAGLLCATLVERGAAFYCAWAL